MLVRSNGSSYPFQKIHQPFERLESSVQENSSAVRTARAVRSWKSISRSNGSSHPFVKIHQPFERLEPSVRENSSAVWTARDTRSKKIISSSNGLSHPFEKIHQPFEHLLEKFQQDKTRLQNSSPGFVKWRMPSCLHYANSHHASVLCLPSLNDTQFIFYGKTFDSQAPVKSKALRSLRVRGGFRRHALLPCERD